MFHDLGLTAHYESSQLRFEVDGANAAGEFLRRRGISESDIETVWTAVALHTTPGIPEFMRTIRCGADCLPIGSFSKARSCASCVGAA
jgi:hypothetical protein